jgi:hypothetical protein
MGASVSTPSNLLIVGMDNDATSTTIPTDSTFGNTYAVTEKTSVKVAPVSSIDGQNFYYADASAVNGNGTVSSSYTFNTYDSENVTDYQKIYAGSVGYVDYTFALKAVNTKTDENSYVYINTLNLTYSDTAATTSTKAFRVAVLVQDTTSNNTSFDTSIARSAIYSYDGAEYFTKGKAVTAGSQSGTTTYDEVANLNSKINVMTIEAGTVAYAKVTVRLWLEGEDTTCTNTTFATLDGKWNLDLALAMSNSSGADSEDSADDGKAVKVLSSDSSVSAISDIQTGVASGDTSSPATYVIDGKTYTAFNALFGETRTTLYGNASEKDSVTNWYVISYDSTNSGYVFTDVTNRVVVDEEEDV